MRRIVCLALLLLLSSTPVPAADSPTPAEQYKALVKKFNDASLEFSKLYQKATTDEERSQVFRKHYPNADQHAEGFLALAKKYPKDPVAVDALVWAATHANGQPLYDALDVLTKEHVASNKIGPVCQMVIYRCPPEQTAAFLRAVLEKNTDRATCAAACLGLAQSAGSNPKEAETLFERVRKEFGDVKFGRGDRTYGSMADGYLFELRNLAIGKKAPEIEGEDIDGKKFRLSDYRGKVVVLDFWGNW
jgi:hypothetical protein